MRIAVRLGGNLNNGANAGLLYFNANNAPSNANWNYGGEIFPYSSPSGHGALTTLNPLTQTNAMHRAYFSGVGNN